MENWEANLRALGGRLVIKLQGSSEKELFRMIAQAMEVFAADEACGMCGSPLIHLRVRKSKSQKGPKTYEYFEYLCTACGAILEFGQSMDQVNIFPKRSKLPQARATRGWIKFNRQVEAGDGRE
jgi:hypothetical protein